MTRIDWGELARGSNVDVCGVSLGQSGERRSLLQMSLAAFGSGFRG
jgi:hypothetical protein